MKSAFNVIYIYVTTLRGKNQVRDESVLLFKGGKNINTVKKCVLSAELSVHFRVGACVKGWGGRGEHCVYGQGEQRGGVALATVCPSSLIWIRVSSPARTPISTLFCIGLTPPGAEEKRDVYGGECR